MCHLKVMQINIPVFQGDTEGMKMKLSPFISLESIFVIVFLLLQSIDVSCQQFKKEREFSYTPGSPTAPEHWGELDEEWRACSNHTGQSPIDIKNVVLQNLPMLDMNYTPSHATIVNHGLDIRVIWDDGAGAVSVNGTEYSLKQLHGHSPSEHTIIDGSRYDLEGHLVHQSAAGQITVIGILYKLEQSDPFLCELEPYIKKIVDEEGRKEDLGIIDPTSLKFGRKNYYRYTSSLTTPPCTDGILWTIIKDVMSVSIEQLQLLKSAVRDDSENNARPVQPSNNRRIFSTFK